MGESAVLPVEESMTRVLDRSTLPLLPTSSTACVFPVVFPNTMESASGGLQADPTKLPILLMHLAPGRCTWHSVVVVGRVSEVSRKKRDHDHRRVATACSVELLRSGMEGRMGYGGISYSRGWA